MKITTLCDPLWFNLPYEPRIINLNKSNFFVDIFCDSKHPLSVSSVTSVVLFLMIYSSDYFLD